VILPDIGRVFLPRIASVVNHIEALQASSLYFMSIFYLSTQAIFVWRDYKHYPTDNYTDTDYKSASAGAVAIRLLRF